MSDAFFPPQISDTIFHKLYEQKDKTGLYVVATPIGNIFDISLRALYILKRAKYVFAEDTRQSKKLLNFYGIDTRLIACHEYNEIDDSVTSLIQANEIYALISDAGTPTISDPGYRLVNWCIEHSIDVFPIPGACAFVAGLSVSGLPTDNFAFHGFLPPKTQARKTTLENLKTEKMTMIFLESPKRISATLSEMFQIFGNRNCCVCREITKIFEEYRRGSLSELSDYFSKNIPVGEFVVLVAGAGEETPSENDFLEELETLLQTDSVKNAVRLIHEKYHISKSLVYKNALEIQKRQR